MCRPASPAPGAVWALGAAPQGDWAGQAGQLALWEDTGWSFVAPQDGWRAWGQAEAELRVWRAGGWALPAAAPPLALDGLQGLGIGTPHDVDNRLAVASPATLFTHDGAGHQLKINKAGPGDTASLLFQQGWSGRAEIGLMGDAGLALKVSADGAAWTEALRADPATGRVQLPQGGQVAPGSAGAPGLGFLGDADTGLFRPGPDQLGFAAGGVPRAVLSAAGLQLDVPLTGTAVSESALDTTAGRLARVGYAGLGLTGNGIGAPGNDANLCLSTAFNYRFSTSGINCPISNPYGGSLHVFRGVGGDAASYRLQQMFLSAANVMYHRASGDSGVTWSSWRRLLHNEIILGTVAQSSGAPTGAILERGSNANGDYLRLADGTQICTRSAVPLTYRSANHIGADWTFPASFAASPFGVVTGPGLTGDYTDVDPAALGVSLWAYSGASVVAGFRRSFGAPGFAATAQVNNCRLLAIGRWF